MASYKVILKPSFEKDLRSLSKSAITRVINSLDLLAENPFPRQALKLEGGGQLYRLRVGDYRIVYGVNQQAKQVLVHYVRHRRDVYRKL
jgi:mRNA interferase RelE/StbE